MKLLPVFLVVAVCGLGPAVFSQSPTFSTRVEAVRVDVLVTDGGRPVRGLQREDFEIFDDGVPQQVDLVSFEQLPLNVILALDASESVAGERLDHLRAASRELLAGLQPVDQAALITFSRTVHLAAPLSHDTTEMRAAIGAIAGRGPTALHDAAYSSLVLSDSDPGRWLAILFTDGTDTCSYFTREEVVDTARRSNAVVYAVSAGRGRMTFLHDITKQTGGRLLQIESTKDLGTTFTAVLDEFRQRYLVSYSPRGVAREGWHELTVKLRGGRRGAVKARPGYFAAPVRGR